MHYTVVATPAAEDELAFIWGMASDRDAVSRASNQIDRLLRHSPSMHGVDHGTFLTLTVDPLTAVCKVSPDDRQVTIIQYMYHG